VVLEPQFTTVNVIADKINGGCYPTTEIVLREAY